MPKFGEESTRLLKAAHPDLQYICNELIKIFNCKVLCTFRGEADQNKAVAEGKSKTPWPKSKHNHLPARAVDLAPWFDKEPHIRWDNRAAFFYMMGMAVAIAAAKGIKVRVGCNWNMDTDPDGWDLPHLELV
jgi:hypothetical protein